MTVYANLDDGKQVQFATTQGWGDVGRLIDGLDESEFPTLTHLREFGWTEELPLLKPEIASAEIDADDPAVKDVLMNLLRFVDDAEDDAVLVISNGMGPSGSDGRSPGKSPKPANRLKRLLKAKQSTNGKHLDEVGVKNKNWVTLESGTHVFIEGGKVTAGPASLTGKPINRLSSPKKPGATKPPSNLQATKPATQKPESQLKPPAVKPASKPEDNLNSAASPKVNKKPPQNNSGEISTAYKVPEHLDSSAKAAIGKLSKPEHAAVVEYTMMGFLVNSKMRVCAPSMDCLSPKDKQYVEKVEGAISKAPPLKEPVTVFRGIDGEPAKIEELLKNAIKSMNGQKSFSMPSITSTSLNPSVATKFSKESNGKSSLVFHIKAKNGLYVESMSPVKGEHELLQSSKTSYRVADVKRNVSIGDRKGNNVIYLEEV